MTNRRIGTALATSIAVVLVLAVLIGSCRDPQPNTLPPPSSTSSTEATTSTTEPDFSLVALPEIDGTTTTTAPMERGRATLRGIVLGPEGPVPNAVIRAERLVGDAVQTLEGRSGADGTFALENVPGGRFRVRAFLPPSLAMAEPDIFFHEDGDVRDMRLVLEPFTGVVVREAVRPAAPTVGDGVNLAVRVAERRVGDDGIGREVPIPGVQVQVNASGWTPLDPQPVQITGADGVAVFQFRCDRVGTVSATAVIGGLEEVFPLDAPACSPVATTTTTTTSTTTTDDDDDDDDDRTTTTSTSSTTTTTEA